MGHQYQFVQPSPTVGCAFGQKTFAGMHGNGQDAPKSAVRALPKSAGGSANPRSPYPIDGNHHKVIASNAAVGQIFSKLVQGKV
jgi:hypothetical protein